LRRLERLGLDAAQLPDRVHRLLEALGDGVDVHIRTADLDPLVARLERLGNRIAVSVLTAAVINSVAQSAAARRRRDATVGSRSRTSSR
jgi:ubiquinone biosynthesis protein